MIDASAFLSVARARPITRAPPLRDAHVAALAAGFTRRAARWAAWSSCSPRVGPADADGCWPACRWRTRTPSTPACMRPPGRPASDGQPRPAASVLRRWPGMAR